MQKYNYRKFQNSKQKKLKIIKVYLVVMFVIIIGFLGFLTFRVITLEKFIYINNKDGNAEIIIVDPQKESPTKMFIDKNFLLKSSRNYGEYKLSNLWILSRKEKTKGRLVAETIVKNFSIPIYYWKDGKQTNLNIFQKLKIIFIKNNNNYNFILESTSLSDNVLIYFIDNNLYSHGPYKMLMEDMTGDKEISYKLSKILETFGVKTTLFKKGYEKNLECQIGGEKQNLVKIVAKILTCEDIIESESFDLRIRVGKVFIDRF